MHEWYFLDTTLRFWLFSEVIMHSPRFLVFFNTYISQLDIKKNSLFQKYLKKLS